MSSLASKSPPSLTQHLISLLSVALSSFVLNQLPFTLSARPDSIGNDGDSAVHVAIQLKLRSPELFPKDIELNEIYLSSRPAFEFAIHRCVVWISQHITDGNLLLANILVFWMYHLFFILGCYLLGRFVLQTWWGGTLFAAASVSLSLSLSAWWGMVYGAVIPHDLSLAFTPWFMLGFLRWQSHSRRMVILFGLLGLAANLYPLQALYLMIVLLGVLALQRRTSVLCLSTAAFLVGAAPAVWVSAIGTFNRFTTLSQEDRAIIDQLFALHYGYLLLKRLRSTIGVLVRSPVWFFLGIGGLACWMKLERKSLSPTDRLLLVFTVITLVLSLFGLVGGALARPLVTFLFHRASAFLYVGGYLFSLWFIMDRWRDGQVLWRVLAVGLLGAIMLNGWQYSSLHARLFSVPVLQSSPDFYALAEWAKGHTEVSAHFMVPPKVANGSFFAFRVYAERGLTTQWAAGETVLSSPQAAIRYWPMAQDITPLYEQPTDTDDFVRIAHKYDADYIVTNAATPRQPNLPIAYHDETFTVFLVPPE